MVATKTLRRTMDYRAAFSSLGYVFAFNEVTRKFEANGIEIDLLLESKIICNMRDLGAKNESVILRELYYAAGENKYHPIKKYLSSLSYDGKDYIAQLCGYFQADKYFEVWLRRFLIMAIARANNGTQCPVLVLDGPQYIGKSKFIQWLCSSPKILDYYTEGQIAPDSKDCRIRAAEKWIWEVPEFGATARRADVEALKGFLTQAEITERAPYEKNDTKRPMLACFIGTINNGAAGFLTDPSGSRRFLITHIDAIDWHGYSDNLSPDSIWGQACAEYLIGEPTELTKTELDLLNKNNEQYEVTNPLQAAFESIFEIEKNPKTFMPTIEIIDSLQLSGFKGGTTNALSRDLSQLLMKLGLKKDRQRVNGLGNPIMGYHGIRRIGP